MGKYLENIQCPACDGGHGLAVYRQQDGSIDGYCHKCGQYFADPYGGVKAHLAGFKASDHSRGLDWIEQNTTVIKQKYRGILPEIFEEYKVRCTVDPMTGEVDALYFPQTKAGKISGYQEKTKEKVIRSIGDTKDCEIFGQARAGNSGKMVVITEGHEDCLAAFQMFKQAGKNYRVLSLPNGASAKSVQRNLEWLDKFESIVLSLDMDEPGQKAAKEIAELFKPGKVKIMKYSEKDANQMLLAGKEREYFQDLYNAREFRPDGIVSVDELIDQALIPIEMGLSWPWETLTKYTYGRRRKELYGIGAAQGNGKSEFCKELIQHITMVDNLPVGGFFLEEPPDLTLKQIAGKLKNRRFHIPNGNWTFDELRDGLEQLRGKIYLYKHEGCNSDWESLKNKIRFFVKGLGIKDIILDNLTAVVAGEEDEQGTLKTIMQELASMVQEMDCTIYYISHLATPNGTPHEEGGRVMASHFRGSRVIAFWSHFMFGLERNQQEENEIDRNITTFRVLKDRYTGLSTGQTFKLFYNHDSGRWEELSQELMSKLRQQSLNKEGFDDEEF